MPQVFARQCSTCVFRPGNPMHLRPGRLADLVRTNLAAGAALICHKTTHGAHPEIGETVCAGWFERYGGRTTSIQVMGRLAQLRGEAGDGFVRIEPPD